MSNLEAARGGQNQEYRDPLISIKGLSASYDEQEVLHDVSFDMGQGEIVCIVGESGSGKSSLVKAIHGMGDISITGGRILFEGKDMSALSAEERRRIMGPGIGLIPQNPASSFNPIRRYDKQFREALAGHNMPYDEDSILEILETIGISRDSKVLASRPYELSGGMNQRIAIAAAMMFRPGLLICDEATSALDVTTAGAVVEKLLEIRDAMETAILMVTHHLGIARRMADSIGIMKNGRLVEYGRADDIFNSPEDEYTRRLIADVPKLKR